MKILRSRVRVLRGWLLLLVMLVGVIALASCAGGIPARGWSGPTLEDNTLYVGTRDGRLVAISATDGTILWSSATIEAGRSSSPLGCSGGAISAVFYGSPAVSDSQVYIGAYAGNPGIVYSFVQGDSQPDRTLTSVRVGDKDVAIGAIVGSAVLGGGDLFFGDSNGRVYGLNDRLQPLWADPFKTDGKIWSTPAFDNGTVYIGSFDRKLYALDANTGQAKWEFLANGVFVSTPLVSNGVVYAGSFDRRLYAIDATSGLEKWHFEARQGFWAQPVIYNGNIYAASLDGRVYVLSAASGEKLAEVDLGAPVSSSPAMVGETLVVATEQSPGNATDKAGAVLWAINTTTYQGAPLARLTGEKVHGPLAGGNGSAFVHTDRDFIYAVNASTGVVTQFNTK